MLKAYLKKMTLPTVIMIWSATYFLECQSYKLKSRRLVSIVFFMMLGLYIINGLTDYLEVRKAYRQGAAATKKAASGLSSSAVIKMAAIFAVLIVYTLMLDRAGFIITTLIGAGLIMWIMGERKAQLLILIPIILVTLLYVIFNFGLRVPLPKGILGIL